MDPQEVLEVFANPSTAHLYDRQSAVLRRLLSECGGGFRYRQLSAVCELLDLVWSRIEAGAQQFVSQLQELIALCALPLLRDKANEEFTGGLIQMERLVGALGRFLHFPIESIQIATCEALRELSLGKDAIRSNVPVTVRVLGAAKPVHEDLRPMPRDLNQGLLLRAGVVTALCEEIRLQVQSLASALAQAEAEQDGNGRIETERGLILTRVRGAGLGAPDDDEDDDEGAEVTRPHAHISCGDLTPE